MFSYYKTLYINSKQWLLASAFLFGIGLLGGIMAYFQAPWMLESLMKTLSDKYGQPELNTNTSLMLLKNNATVAGLGLAGGLIFGIPTVFILVVNGLILGFIGAGLFTRLPYGIFQKILFLVVGIVPHGIFELSAIILSGAFGLMLGNRWWLAKGQGRVQVFWQDIKRSLTVIPVVAMLLIIAGFVEVFVSGKLLEVLFK